MRSCDLIPVPHRRRAVRSRKLFDKKETMKPSLKCALFASALVLAASSPLCGAENAAAAAAASAASTPQPYIDQGLNVCSPFAMRGLSNENTVLEMTDEIDEAIDTLDNGKVEFTTPVLAGGEINVLTITPSYADRPEQACIMGYFEGDRVVPALVDHLETTKGGSPDQPVSTTKIYFRVPTVEKLFAGYASHYWKFWVSNKPMTMKIAIYRYQDKKLGTPYLGRELKVEISPKANGIGGALLFALFAYVVAALSISRNGYCNNYNFHKRLMWLVRSLYPWCLAGSSGKASLAQLQMIGFTIIIAALLFLQFLRTGVMQEISIDLLYLIGISTVGAGASQLTGSIKQNLNSPAYSYVQQLGWFTVPRKQTHYTALPSQLLLTNNRFDVYKLQMLLFSVVVAGYVIHSGASALASVVISPTILTLMGISQGVYVGGQAASDEIKSLQDTLFGMQTLQRQYYATGVPTDELQRLAAYFNAAARKAADEFGAIFERDVPEQLLTMPGFPLLEEAAAPSA